MNCAVRISSARYRRPAGAGWVHSGLDFPVLPALAHIRIEPRGGMGEGPAAAGGRLQIAHTLAATRDSTGGVTGAEPPYNCSGQWLETTLLLTGSRSRNGVGSAETRCMREFATILRCTPQCRVQLRFRVGTGWRGISASGGWRCIPSLGETQCRRQAWPYRRVRQLGRVRGQARGRHLRGSDGTGGTGSGWTPSIRHLLRISTPGRRGML